jgi:hypothetical protein
MDRAVSQLDFRVLAGKTVYLDSTPIKKTTDADYLVSLLRQHMLATGCLLRDKKEDADYVVEARVGAVGTDRQEVMFGVPSVNIPAVVPVNGMPSQIPEMPIVKKTDQRAVTKLAVFAYNRQKGRAVWQSGTIPTQSTAKDFWVLGAGPFQKGTIYGGTNFAGDELDIPLIDLQEKQEIEKVAVAGEAHFIEPEDRELLADVDTGPGLHSTASDPMAGGGQKSNSAVSQVVPATVAGPADRRILALPAKNPVQGQANSEKQVSRRPAFLGLLSDFTVLPRPAVPKPGGVEPN